MDDAPIFGLLMGILTQIKLYHWATMKYAQHKALDELHAAMQEHVDAFIEVYMGRFKRQPLGRFTVSTGADSDAAPAKVEKYLTETRDELQKLHKTFAKATELQNLLDEMMAAIDRTLYLCKLT